MSRLAVRLVVAIALAATAFLVAASAASADITAVVLLPAGGPIGTLVKNNQGAVAAVDVNVRVTCAANEGGQRLTLSLTVTQGNGSGTGAGNATGSATVRSFRSRDTEVPYLCPVGGGSVTMLARVFSARTSVSFVGGPRGGGVAASASGDVRTGGDPPTGRRVIPATAFSVERL